MISGIIWPIFEIDTLVVSLLYETCSGDLVREILNILMLILEVPKQCKQADHRSSLVNKVSINKVLPINFKHYNFASIMKSYFNSSHPPPSLVKVTYPA